MTTERWFATLVALGCALFTSVAGAQDTYVHVDYDDEEPREDYVFVEGTGGYGFQLGETDYLPNSSASSYEHPLVHGFTVGGTAGVFVIPSQVALIANYEYTNARTRVGDVPGVIGEIQGTIDYHTLVGGLRLRLPVGWGALHAEIAAGVVLPYETELEVDHGAGLAPAGITGTGRRIDHYSLGVGGHSLVGYEMPITGPLYIAANLKLKMFQSTNDGETTELRNFVTDYTQQPPSAIDTTIHYGDGRERPSTNSVQEARLQIALGARF